MKRQLIAAALLVAAVPLCHAGTEKSYTELSRAVVLVTTSPDLIGDASTLDPAPFAKCFRAQGLTKTDLNATIKLGTAGPRVKRCLDKLIGL
jgi:hypothetical protein